MGLVEDLRYALRAFKKNRGFAAVAVLSLALGIGANTTIFSMLDAILLRPLSVWEPDRLVAVYTTDSRIPGNLQNSYLNYKDYRDRNQVFSSLLLHSPTLINMTGLGEPRTVMAHIVSGNYFATLGVKPYLGRWFLPEEDVTPGAIAVAVISHGMWMRLYGGDPQITSRIIRLENRDFNIVGVAPPEFQGLSTQYAADVWVPLMMYPQVFSVPAAINQRRALYFSVAGRLKPGVTQAQAEASLQVIAQNLAAEYPKDDQGRRVRLLPAEEGAIAARTRGAVTSAGMVLMTVSGLVLLIACANVANLLLARAAGRIREITVRLALGASRWQLMRQLLVESTLLSVIGGACSLLVARWARDVLWSMRPPEFKYAVQQLPLDYRVFLYSFAISVVTGLLFGLIPAVRATSTDLATDLKDRGGQPPSARGGWHPRSLLVMGQVAFSLMALVGAGLFLRSLLNASRIDPGFDSAHLGSIGFSVDQSYNEARGREFDRRALELAAAVPGVDSVTMAKDPPMKVASARTVLLPGQDNTAAGGQGRLTLTGVTWPGYFRTVRMPIVRGRDFTVSDSPASPRVAIVNEAAASGFWPGQEAVGKVIQFYGENLPVQIVGVARNANYREIGEDPQAMIYLSLSQYYFPYSTLYIHTSGNPDNVLSDVRQQIRALDRNLVLDSESFATTIRASLWAQRLSAGLLAVFGGLALLLASIGIYGVISYSVHQRLREMGLRMALGATPSDVQRMVMGEGMRLVAVGVLAGTLISLATSRNLKSMLFAVSDRDAVTFVLVPAVLALVAIFACWIPAHRATRIDPAIALRDE
jgi:predicted permease